MKNEFLTDFQQVEKMNSASLKIKLERITHRHRYERLLNEVFGGDVARARGYYKEMFLNFITSREFPIDHEAYDAEIYELIKEYAEQVKSEYQADFRSCEMKLKSATKHFNSLKTELDALEARHPEWKGMTPTFILGSKDQQKWMRVFREKQLAERTLDIAKYDLGTCSISHFYVIPHLFETKEEYQVRIHEGDGKVNATHRTRPEERDEENSFNNI